MTTFYKEGYFFISFLKKQIFSFDNYIMALQNQNNKENKNKNITKTNEIELKEEFLNEMKITTIFIIDNSLKKELNILEHQKNVFKEIIINKNDIKNKITQISEICDWLKQEIKKGYSYYFNIENFLLNEINNENQENN